MDETFNQLCAFQRCLEEFNERLRLQYDELKKCHNNVDPLWRDEFRRTYDQMWEGFNQSMDTYLYRQAPRFTEFLDEKRIALGRFLGVYD